MSRSDLFANWPDDYGPDGLDLRIGSTFPDRSLAEIKDRIASMPRFEQDLYRYLLIDLKAIELREFGKAETGRAAAAALDYAEVIAIWIRRSGYVPIGEQGIPVGQAPAGTSESVRHRGEVQEIVKRWIGEELAAIRKIGA